MYHVSAQGVDERMINDKCTLLLLLLLLLYSAILRSRADSLRSHVILHE